MTDDINHPSHYADGWSNGSEVIDITENLNFNRGNAVKYLARAGRKNPDAELEDLFKAQWYVNREIKRVEAKNSVALENYLRTIPRTWDRLADIPNGVTAKDNDGDIVWWDSESAEWYFGSTSGQLVGKSYNSYGPFTEVIA